MLVTRVRMAGRLPHRRLTQSHRLKQFVSTPQEHAAGVAGVLPRRGIFRRRKRALTVLANNPLTQILDPNLKPPSTGWAFLHEVSRDWHYCKLLFDSPFRYSNHCCRIPVFVNYAHC